MILKPFTRDSADFQSIRDRGLTISYSPLDMNFNNIGNYLNRKILPIINSLANKEAVGVLGLEGSFLRNVGDGTTRYDFIRNSDIPNFSLDLHKIEKQPKFGIISSGEDEILRSIVSLASNNILTGNPNSLPKWEKLKFFHFENNSILAENVAIGTLSARHLVPDIIGKPLTAGSILTRYIQDNTISNKKIADSSFTNQKISSALMNTRVPIANLKFQNKCFVARTIANNSVDIKEVFFYSINQNPNKLTQLYGILSPANIPLNSIELKKVNTPFTEAKFDVYRQMDNSIIPSKIKAGSLSLPAISAAFNGWPGITTNILLGKNNLSPQIKSILINKGQLKP